MKKFPFIILLLTVTLTSFSQESSYTGLKSKGKIPEEFIELTSKKIEADLAKNSDGLEKVSKNTKERFYEMTNFGISQMLQSGKVCFNDTISLYIESVLEEIRIKNHSVPLNIRVYTVKSPVVNAYTTDQGIIFVNTGLIAQLENEAQLAYILCHELIHYMENHIREGFVEDVEIANRKNDYQSIRNIDKDLASAKFSRKLEQEADVKGLELFLNTDYNPEEIDGVFDVLLYSYLPFDEIPFDSSILEIGEYQIPDKYFLTSLNEIKVNENEDDSKHTHPNIKKRRKKIESLLSKSTKSGKNYLVSKDDFFAVRGAARYEVLRLQLINGEYSEALYSAFILQEEYPENSLPKIAIGEILFGTAMFANGSNRSSVTGYYKKKQGNVQQAYYLLSKLKSKDITLLAIRYNYYLHTLYPDNKVIESRIVDLFRDLIYYKDVEFDQFVFEKAPEIKQSNNENGEQQETTETQKPKSKYDRIKSKKSVVTKTKDGFNKNWAFDEIFIGCDCEYDLSDYYELGEEASTKRKYLNAETGDYAMDQKARTERKKQEKKKGKYGRSLGIDNFVLVDPYYIVYNESTRNSNFRVVKSEQQQIEQLKEYQRLSKKVGLNIQILSDFNLTRNDIDKYNDISLLGEWVDERYIFDKNSNIISSSDEVSGLVEKYGTKYFAWTGVINISLKRKNRWGNFFFFSSTGVGLPLGIYYLLSRAKATYIYFALFNIETGEMVMYEERETRLNDSNGVLSSQYYDIFNQVKR